MSFLASLSAEARDELRSFVAAEVHKALRAQERDQAQHEWLTTGEVAELLATTPNAIRCRLRRDWLAGDVAQDGKRLLIRRSTVLEQLERRAERMSTGKRLPKCRK